MPEATASFTNTTASGNAITMTNGAGYSSAFSGNLHTDGAFTLTNDVITDNSVRSDATGPSGDANGDSGRRDGRHTHKHPHVRQQRRGKLSQRQHRR